MSLTTLIRNLLMDAAIGDPTHEITFGSINPAIDRCHYAGQLDDDYFWKLDETVKGAVQNSCPDHLASTTFQT
jgi:hypothetical protein